MSVGLFSLARMTVASSGTGTITLNTALSGFLTFDLAGCSTSNNGQKVTYAISDGSQSEIGRGTYFSSSLLLTRGSSTAGMKSTNSNSPINMSNAAQVLITPSADDLNNTFGQCYLQPVNTTSLILQPLYGNRLTINNVNQIVSSAGVTLFSTTNPLVADTAYYIYAFMNGSVMTLLPSTALYHVQGDTGLAVMSTNETYTLVGLTATATNAGGSSNFHAFNTSTISWFNPRWKTAIVGGNTAINTTSSSGVEISASLRVPYVTFDNRPVQIAYTARSVFQSLPSQDFFLDVYDAVSSASVFYAPTRARITADAATTRITVSDITVNASLAEGRSYLTPTSYVSGGTATIENYTTTVSVWG